MVTCKIDSVPVPKMNSVRNTRKPSSSNSSGFRLLDADQLETTSSSVSRNSVYKLKIDLMFDDTRSVRSNRLDDPRGSHRTRSIIMYGRSELASSGGDNGRSIHSLLQESNEAAKILADNAKKDVQRISNSVQAQIEQLFTDVAKDATSSFSVTCLGSLPLKDKVTSLQGLQEPLRELYLKEMADEQRNSGSLDICATGLRVKMSTANSSSSNNNNNNSNSGNGISMQSKVNVKSSSKNNGNSNSNSSQGNNTNSNDSSNNGIDGNITPFHNIAVWSAVKFVVSDEDGGAAFLPLITDPENIDKSMLFQPLSPLEEKLLANSHSHAPIFAVVMRSSNVPKLLECHGFICKSTEDAIVIAATLYQSLMAHVSSNSHRSTKRRTPRNQNGVSCVSIASSSAMTGSNYISRSQMLANARKNSFRSTSGSVLGSGGPTPSRSGRKKRISNSSLSSSSNVINELVETTTEERKRKSHKTKRAPPIPTALPALVGMNGMCHGTPSKAYLERTASSHSHSRGSQRSHQHSKQSLDSGYRTHGLNGHSPPISNGISLPGNLSHVNGIAPNSLRSIDTNGDILTRVAIPRSGSFLNTGGLTRYKSRAARRHSGKLGGGGGSPLGFSELFNEFRLHENLHSLDEILYAIIDADGMSFNDLKPIYKEFLLKLAVTLTKDELFQRSKNIMRRQRKKKLKRKGGSASSQKKPRTLFFGAKSLKKVFQLGQFRSCRGKPPKPPRNRELDRHKSVTPITIGSPHPTNSQHQRNQQQTSSRSRVATSGSDVSVVRNDNAFQHLNRNSSSGYVSCSECSYDSESCTCTSADRCYCSLRADKAHHGGRHNHHNHNHNHSQNQNNKLRRKNERNAALSKKSQHKRDENQLIYSSGSNANRDSLISCKTDDKCYCSMVEEEPNSRSGLDEETSSHSHSDTTYCDTDSCVSASKCYCKRPERRAQRMTLKTSSHGTLTGSESEQPLNTQRQRHSRSSTRKSSANDNGLTSPDPVDNLAMDYELFSISGNGKSVQPHEALSVKKSVEAAAIFADVKLSQTTDIKTLCPPLVLNGKPALSNSKSVGSCRSYSSSRKYSAQAAYASRKRESFSIDRKNNERNLALAALSSSSSQKSCSADDLLSKLSAIEKAASIKSIASSRRHALIASHYGSKEAFHSNYQSMRAVSASLEDTLGYLP